MPRVETPAHLTECVSPLATAIARVIDAHRLHVRNYVPRTDGSPDVYVCDTCGLGITQVWGRGGTAYYQLRHQAEQVAAWITAQGITRERKPLTFRRVADEDQASISGGTQLRLPLMARD